MTVVPITSQTKRIISCLIYGPSGVGKTTLVETLDKHGYRVLILNADKGTDTLLNYVKTTGRTLDMIPIENRVDENGKDIPAWIVLQDIVREIKGELKAGTFQYDVVFVDGLTEMCKHCTDHVIADKQRIQPSQGEWYDITTRVANFVKMMRDLPVHVVFSCLEKSEMTDAQELEIVPDLVGQLRGRVPAFLDEVFYMSIREHYDKETDKTYMVRFILTDVEIFPGTRTVKAKDRSKEDRKSVV